MEKYIFFSYSMTGGGAEKNALLLANKFASEGYTIEFFLVYKKGVFLTELDKSIKVRNIPALFRYFRLTGMLFYSWFFFLNNPVNAIVAVGEWPGLIAPIVCQFVYSKPKIIIVEQNTKTFINSPEFYGLAKTVAAMAIKSYGLAGKIVAVSEKVADSVRESIVNVGDKVSVIYNPISLMEISSKAKAEIEHSWFKEKSIPVLVAVGRLNEQKDYPTMLKAFAIVNSTREMRLAILGDGEKLNDLMDLCIDLYIDDKVSFLGFQNNPYQYMSQADLLVHSAIHEGFPNTFIEAMACGTKIVSTDCDISSTLRDTGLFARIVPSGNYKALAEAIIEEVDKVYDREHLMKQAIVYDIEHVSEKYKRLLVNRNV